MYWRAVQHLHTAPQSLGTTTVAGCTRKPTVCLPPTGKRHTCIARVNLPCITSTSLMSRPRAATSVATRRGTEPLLNFSTAAVRCPWLMSPWMATACGGGGEWRGTGAGSASYAMPWLIPQGCTAVSHLIIAFPVGYVQQLLRGTLPTTPQPHLHQPLSAPSSPCAAGTAPPAPPPSCTEQK